MNLPIYSRSFQSEEQILPFSLLPYMQIAKNKGFIIYFGIFILLVSFYVFKLANQGPFDYDSSSNFLIINDLKNKNFNKLFHHGSPLFFLIFLPVVLLKNSFFASELANLLLVIVGFFCFAAREKNAMPLLLFTGSSVFFLHISRNFSIEGLSILVMGVLYYQRTREKISLPVLYLLCGLALLINYKFTIFFVIWIILETFFFKTFSVRQIFLKSYWMLLPVLCMMFTGYLAGQSFWQYPATLLAIFLNPSNTSELILHDWSFYFLYLFHYEHFLMLAGVFAGIFYFRQLPVAQQVFFTASLGYFLIFLLLPKAPRGLVFVYPVWYLVAFTILKTKLHKTVFYSLLVSGILLQGYRAFEAVFPFQGGAYEQMAEVVKKNSCSQIVSTTGININVHLPKEQQVVPFFSQESLPSAECLLFDGFYLVTNHTFEPDLSQYQLIQELPCSLLASPLLHLEHAEYTKRSFRDCIAISDSLQQSPAKIRFYRKRPAFPQNL